MKPSGSGGPKRTHLFFAFLRVSVPPWCKGLVFGCGYVELRFKVLGFGFPAHLRVFLRLRVKSGKTQKTPAAEAAGE